MRGPVRCAAAVLCAALAGAAGARAQQVVWPTHGWGTASPGSQGLDPRDLADAFDFVREHRIPIHSLQIVRHGYLVLDAYFWPFEDGRTHDLASVTKSVTSTLVGIAIGEGRLSGVEQTLLPLFRGRPIADRDARKERITLAHLLTMTSGLDCRYAPNEITLRRMLASPDWARFVLDLPMADEPGSRYEYCSPGMHLLSAVISRATGQSALDFARRALFAPLGITDVAWPADPQGVSFGWGDLHLQPRDAAKLGYLWLHGGRWEGGQVVPAEYLRDAVRVHVHPSAGPEQEYGFGMWVYPRRDPPMFEALGRGGQRISVVPGTDLVVVLTGGTFEPGDVGAFIGRAIRSDGPLPADSAGEARLAAAVAAAARPPAPQPVPPLPARAAAVSGRRYALEDNPAGIRALTLWFPGGAEARLRIDAAGGRDSLRPVGLDGVPRRSAGGRFDLPVAVSGAWENDSTFVLDYDEVGNINDLRLRLVFSGRAVGVALSERSGLMEARFRGLAPD
jgi:CubicO group peptidase (beta-lactamase class C family)